jgi:hypothetical protein
MTYSSSLGCREADLPRRCLERHRLALLILAGLTAGCGAHQSNPLDALPEAGVGRVVYDAEVQLALDSGSLDVQTALHFMAGESAEKQIRLLLNRALQIRELDGSGVVSYRVVDSEFSPSWSLVEVELYESPAPGTTTSLRLSYGGRPDFPPDGINGISPDWVELNLDSQWFPTVATLDHEMVGDLRVRLPQDWQVASAGATGFDDGSHIIRSRIPQVDVAFTGAPSFQQVPGERFTVYFLQDADRRSASMTLEAADNCAQYLNARYGERDAFPGGRLVLANRQGPGYARKNYIVLSEVDPDQSEGLHYFLCHEIAHYWTRSAGAQSPHHWMTEAFAEYAAAMYLRDRFGQSAFEQRRSQWEVMGRSHGPIWTPETTGRASFFIMYRKAPYLLSQLEDRIGAEQYGRFFERYMVEHIRTTTELLDELALIAGTDVEQWFRGELARQPPR